MIESLLSLLLFSMAIAFCLGLTLRFFVPEVEFTIQLATLLLFLGTIISLLIRTIFGWYSGGSMDHYVYAGTLVFLLALIVGFRLSAPSSVGTTTLDKVDGSDTLVVLIKGLLGPRSITSLHKAVRRKLPTADILTSNYPGFTFSNTDPYRLANTIEHAIHDADQDHAYKRIILAGHSLGAVLLRKALVWAHGAEEDRKNLGIHGPRSWVEKVDRFVSLAGINRGWSLHPKPANMSPILLLISCLGIAIAKATGTGKLLLAARRGAPFIADLRVQWIRIARQDHGRSKKTELPTTIHLLGDIDDIVSREDSQDLAVAKDARFITLLNTNHRDIVTDLETGLDSSERLRQIMNALFLRKELLERSFDELTVQEEDLDIKRIIYILHGIRDYGTWAERLRTVLEKELQRQDLKEVAVTPPKYGYFPMLPFVLFWDRQRNVRKFMDEYTENIARYPLAEEFDFIGHSNGTYILASALQRYPTLKVRNVLFAGSVVPKRYRWRELVDAGRVSKVRNIVATGDWVVALFPRFFEQIAEWLHIDSVKGIFDIGSAGFRGFDDSAKVDPERSIYDTKFVTGTHSTALDIQDAGKLNAIVAFAIHGRDEGIISLKNADEPWGWLDLLSNISWSVWLVLAGLLTLFAYLTLTFGGLIYFGFYLAILAALLFSF